MNKKILLILTLIMSGALAQTGTRRPFDPFSSNAQAPKQALDSDLEKDNDNVDTLAMPSIGDLFFGNSIQGMTDIFKNANNFEVSNREDEKFKYVEIKAEGIDKNNLNISVKEGQISLQGQIKKEEKEGDQVVSSFTSSFMQSFPAPEGVDSANPQFDFKGDVIVIKFKKK